MKINRKTGAVLLVLAWAGMTAYFLVSLKEALDNLVKSLQ